MAAAELLTVKEEERGGTASAVPLFVFGDRLVSRPVAGVTLVEAGCPAGLSLPAHTHEAPYFSLAIQGCYEEKVGAGLTGADLRAAFIAELEKAHREGVIRAHEGRHALDRSEKPTGYSIEELEFRAKLSEVAFSRDPLLVFGAIFDSSIGQAGDPHGMANERIMKGLVAWMGRRAAEIGELDSARPVLPQFDKLTAEQMRAAFRSMDPWAK